MNQQYAKTTEHTCTQSPTSSPDKSDNSHLSPPHKSVYFQPTPPYPATLTALFSQHMFSKRLRTVRMILFGRPKSLLSAFDADSQSRIGRTVRLNGGGELGSRVFFGLLFGWVLFLCLLGGSFG